MFHLTYTVSVRPHVIMYFVFAVITFMDYSAGVTSQNKSVFYCHHVNSRLYSWQIDWYIIYSPGQYVRSGNATSVLKPLA